MSAHAPNPHANDWDSVPYRREQDRIFALETQIRRLLLGGNATDAAIQTPVPLLDAIQQSLMMLVQEMHEIIGEIWLVEMPPWGEQINERTLRQYANATANDTIFLPHIDGLPGDILLAVVTAGRPMRFDDAIHHPLVREWVKGAGLDPDSITTFLGTPVFYHGMLLGVIAIGMDREPSPDHITLIDSIADVMSTCLYATYIQFDLERNSTLNQAIALESPIAMAVLTNNGTLAFTNHAFDRLLQTGPDVWGHTIDVVLPDHAQQLRTAWQIDEVLRSGQERTILELPIRLTTGMTYWDFTVRPLLRDQEHIEYILLAAYDVTAYIVQRQRQKRTIEVAQGRVYQMVELHQISLEVSAQLGQDPLALLKQILERMVRIVGATGGIVFYGNHENGELEVAISTGFAKDYTGIHLEKGIDLAGRVFSTGEGQSVAEYTKYPLRSHAFADEPFGAVAAIPMKQRGRVNGVIWIIHERDSHSEDIKQEFTDEEIWMLDLFAAQAATALENARTYQELERAYQQQRTLDRQKDDFIARVSHDLRLPLTSVVGLLDLLQDEVNSSDPSNETTILLQQAEHEAQRLADMLDQMLSLARIDSGKRDIKLSTLRLAAIVDDIVRARQKHGTMQGTDHKFTIDIPQEIRIMADLSRSKEVLENLISNAIKYSPQGGMITVYGQIEQDSAQLRIKDEGLGIAAEARESIFERFSRIESPLISEIRGTGLGLYIARQLMESMGGALILEQSEPGQGSTFLCTFPLSPVDATSETM